MAGRPPPKMGPGRRVVFRPDHSKATGFGGFILSDQVRDATVAVADDIADLTSHLAPRSNGPGPHMADQYRVKRDAGTIKVAGNIRVRVLIENDDPAAALTEFGTERNPRSRQLARAAAIFGDFRDHGTKEA